MIHNRKPFKILGIKQLAVYLFLIIGIFIIPAKAEASSVTTYLSSDSKEAYYSVELLQDKVLIDGKTTDNKYAFDILLYKLEDEKRFEFTGTVSDGIFNVTINLPTTNGIVDDGTYLLLIYLNDAKWGPYISVTNGEAVIYGSNSYETDLVANSFLQELNKEELLSVSQPSISNFYFSLLMTDEQIEEIHQMALKITEGFSSDYDKTKAIYQWITDNIYYDEEGAVSGKAVNNAYRVFKNRYAVCDGYARLMMEMLRSVDIPSVMVLGYGQLEPISDDNGGAHAWLAIYADERWFYADPTWDSSNLYRNQNFIYGGSGLQFFDMTLQAISSTHRITDLEAKISKDDFNFIYYDKQVSVESYKGDEKIIMLPDTINDLKVTQLCFDFEFGVNYFVNSIIIPDGYETIGGVSLIGYVNLNSVVFPDTITSIGNNIFWKASNVIIYSENNQLVEDYAKENSININFVIPDDLKINQDTAAQKIDIGDADFSMIRKVTYTGKDIKPKLTITIGGKTLSPGKDYNVDYVNNVMPGEAFAIIEAKGDYTGGIIAIPFAILPKQTWIRLYSEKQKTIRITWGESSGAEGYEVYFSSIKGGKYKKLTQSELLKFTSGTFKSGTVYYFKVRPYIILHGKKVYGAFSKVKYIKVM